MCVSGRASRAAVFHPETRRISADFSCLGEANASFTFCIYGYPVECVFIFPDVVL